MGSIEMCKLNPAFEGGGLGNCAAEESRQHWHGSPECLLWGENSGSIFSGFDEVQFDVIIITDSYPEWHLKAF